MRVLAVMGVLVVAMLPVGISAPAQATVVYHGSPGKCPPGSYWTHLPTPGVTATASGFCKSYVVRPTTKAPLKPLPPRYPPHGPPHHVPPPPHFPHHHGYPPGSCPAWDHWSSRLNACLAGGIVKPVGNAPLTPGARQQCPPGSYWQAGTCQPSRIPSIKQTPGLGGPASKPSGPALGIKPLRRG